MQHLLKKSNMKNNDLLSACLVLYPFRSGLSKIKKILMVILVVFLPLTIVKAGNTKSSMEISQQQKKQISGLIRDVNNEPIIGANIIEKNVPGNGTVTDVDGRFTLSIEENATILVSYIGYLPQEISVAGKTYFEVILQEDTKTLDEVVVIGYGSQSRETITTSVTKLDNKVLENVPYANAASALQGSVSGVRVQSISGQPGAAPRIIVRGGTSINNPNGAAPLYIIDGVIRPDMNNISSDDIESIQVLKDAASTAIYGARGSNGVVIITTKSGKTDQLRVNYSFDYTISKVGKLYDFVNARQYIELNRYGLAHRPDKFPAIDLNRLTLPMGYGTGNDLTNNTAFTLQYLTPENEHKLKEGWQSMPDPADPSKTLIFQDTDFQSLTYQTGLSNNHHIDVSGGSDKATLRVGVGYLSNEGTVITTEYNRLSFDINGEIKARENLSIYGGVRYSNSKQKNPSFGTDVTFYRSAGLAPTAKLKFEDGTLAPGTQSSIGNPLYHMNTLISNNSTDNLTLTMGANWRFLPGFSFDPQVSMYNVSSDSYSFQPGFWNGPLSYVTTRNASAGNNRWKQRQADAVFSYFTTVNTSHNIDSKLGFSYYDRQVSNLSANGRGASTDLIPTLNAVSEPTSISSSISDQVIIGYFGRLNYNYLQKYLLSLNFRYDGASNLGANYKWGFFPGISMGWNLHKENFWSTIPEDFSSLKVRGSYGVNGNISGLGDFQAQGAYSVGAKYNGNAAIQNSVLPNSDLKWEQSKTFDIGLDLGLYENRISFLFDYFVRHTDNLLTNLSLPRSTGFSSILTNLGSLENKGIELEISANMLPSTSTFQWDLSFNASRVSNKILSLPHNGIENNRIGGDYVWDSKLNDYAWKGGLQEGGRIGDMYSLKQIGIYSTDEEAATAPIYTYIVGANKTQYGGDTKWLDSDNNGVIDSKDQVYMGNTFPVWTGGFNNSFSYKNFNLYVRMDYAVGHTIFNYAKLFLDMNGYADGTFTLDKYNNSWKKQGDIAKYSRYYWGGERVQRNNFLGVTDRGNSVFYQRGDFLSLRELTLSYTVPTPFVEQLKLRNIRLNVTGNNLHYFTKYDGLNPEEGGRDNGHYPMPRNFIFSINVTF